MPWIPLALYLGSGKPRRLLYFTKGTLVERWIKAPGLPRSLGFAVRPGLPTRQTWDALRSVCEHSNAVLGFAGDLRPLDLTVYLILRSGDPDLRFPHRERLQVRYCGIDDAWLKLCERHLVRGRTLEDVLIPMSSVERRHLSVLEKLFPNLEDLIGPRSLAILKSERTLHLEGATAPGLYGDAFSQELLVHLAQRLRAR